MKKSNSLFAVLLTALCIPAVSFAQYAKNTIRFNPSTLYGTASVIAGEESDRSALDKLRVSNEKAFKSFLRDFKGATDVYVDARTDGTFLSCLVDGIRNRIQYSPKGRWRSTIQYLNASQIPEPVVSMVAHNYPEYNILRASKVIVPEGFAYLVDIDNCSRFKTIRVNGDGIDVYQEFEKAQ